MQYQFYYSDQDLPTIYFINHLGIRKRKSRTPKQINLKMKIKRKLVKKQKKMKIKRMKKYLKRLSNWLDFMFGKKILINLFLV